MRIGLPHKLATNGLKNKTHKQKAKVIEFNKETKRIILSHSRIFEDAQKAAEVAEAPKKAAKKSAKKEEAAAPSVEKTTLGDIESLAALKESLEAAEKKSKK